MTTQPLSGAPIPPSHVLGRKLDNIPFSAYHVVIILVLGFVGFVEGYDLALTGSLLVLAKGPLHMNADAVRALATWPTFLVVIGGFAAAGMSDRVSRLTVMQIGVILSTLCTLLILLVHSFEQLLILRLITGFFLGFTISAPFPIAAELMPAQHRRTYAAIYETMLAMAFTLLPFVGFVLADHPKGFQLVGLPGGVTLFIAPVLIYFLIPESPRWLLRRGRAQDAVDNVNLIVRRCGNKVPPIMLQALGDGIEAGEIDRSWEEAYYSKRREKSGYRTARLNYFLSSTIVSALEVFLIFFLLRSSAAGIVSVVLIAGAVQIWLAATRLQDIGSSLWWLLLMFVPFVNVFLQMFLYFERGFSDARPQLIPYWALFRQGQFRWTATGILCGLCAGTVYYLIAILLPKALVSQGAAVALSFGLSSLVFAASIPGKLFNGFIMEVIGRRWTITGAFLLSIPGLLLMVTAHLAGSAATIVFSAGALITGFTTLSIFPAVRMYLSEQFPTALRGRGHFFGESFARIFAGVLVPYVMVSHTASPVTFFGTMIVMVLIGACIPFALGRETIGNLETFTEALPELA